MPVNINLEFKLSPKQRMFVESQRPWTAFIGGVGSGKTHAGAIKSLVAAIEEPGSFGVIAAPTYSMMKDVTQRKFFEFLPEEMKVSFNKNDQKLTLINGSEIVFRSMDEPDKIRGINAAWFWLDEGPLAGYYSWLMLKQRAGRQNIEKFRKRGWITGTPKGRDGYYNEFVRSPTAEHFLIQAPTYENLKHLPSNYIMGMGLEGAFYQQEVEGSFEAFEGLIYQFRDERDLEGYPLPHSHVQDPPRGKRFKKIFGGVDWGYANPAVALVFGVDGDDRVYQIAEFYEKYQELDADFLPAIIKLTKEFGVERWWCDPAEPEHIQALKNKLDESMLPCEAEAADNTVTTGIQTVKRFLGMRPDGMPGLLVAESCKATAREFGSYQYDKKPEDLPDTVVNEKPKKQADHAMDSLRYALHNELGDIFSTGSVATTRTSNQDSLRAMVERQAARSAHDDDFLYERRTNAARSMRWLIDRTGG